MNLDQVNKWLTLVANFGVIGGLVLVAMQMHFNTDAISLQNALENNRGIASAEVALMGDSTAVAWSTAALHPAELTESQLLQLWAYQDVQMLTVENTWLAYQDGLASKQVWDDAKNGAARGGLGYRAGRIWWEHMKFVYDPDFVKQIDAELAGRDPDELKHATQETLDQIRSIERNEVTQPAT